MNNVKNVKVESLNVVGSVKKVNEFTFTLVDRSDKMRYMVEVTVDGTDFNDLVIVAHNTWRSGKFVKVIHNILKEQKENEESAE